MKARRLRAILERKPLRYRVVRQAGSQDSDSRRTRPAFALECEVGEVPLEHFVPAGEHAVA